MYQELRNELMDACKRLADAGDELTLSSGQKRENQISGHRLRDLIITAPIFIL
jgi:hypothetical protein